MLGMEVWKSQVPWGQSRTTVGGFQGSVEQVEQGNVSLAVPSSLLTVYSSPAIVLGQCSAPPKAEIFYEGPLGSPHLLGEPVN